MPKKTFQSLQRCCQLSGFEPRALSCDPLGVEPRYVEGERHDLKENVGNKISRADEIWRLPKWIPNWIFPNIIAQTPLFFGWVYAGGWEKRQFNFPISIKISSSTLNFQVGFVLPLPRKRVWCLDSFCAVFFFVAHHGTDIIRILGVSHHSTNNYK